jgi:hypothetical protein
MKILEIIPDRTWAITREEPSAEGIVVKDLAPFFVHRDQRKDGAKEDRKKCELTLREAGHWSLQISFEEPHVTLNSHEATPSAKRILSDDGDP